MASGHLLALPRCAGPMHRSASLDFSRMWGARGGKASSVRALSNVAFLADRPIRHALVLGGSGFLGAALVRRLCAAGVRTTCLVHRRPPPVPEAEVLRGSLDGFRWRSLEEDPPDVIFHLARIAGRGGIRGAVTRVRNRVANERLLLWLASCARPPLLIYVGGTLAYGSHGEQQVTEQTPLTPISFARDYQEAELPWLRALRGNDAPVIVARPAWVLGPASWFEVYYRRFMRMQGAVPLYGAGENWMSLVHVEDCAGLLAHAARCAPPAIVVNVLVGPAVRQAELAERLSRVASVPIRRVSLDEMELRFGRAVREAFEFSARVGTVHEALYARYTPEHQDLDRDLATLIHDPGS
jgi:nucleoside-diphosphate-sugar epimerase